MGQFYVLQVRCKGPKQVVNKAINIQQAITVSKSIPLVPDHLLDKGHVRSRNHIDALQHINEEKDRQGKQGTFSSG